MLPTYVLGNESKNSIQFLNDYSSELGLKAPFKVLDNAYDIQLAATKPAALFMTDSVNNIDRLVLGDEHFLILYLSESDLNLDEIAQVSGLSRIAVFGTEEPSTRLVERISFLYQNMIDRLENKELKQQNLGFREKAILGDLSLSFIDNMSNPISVISGFILRAKKLKKHGQLDSETLDIILNRLGQSAYEAVGLFRYFSNLSVTQIPKSPLDEACELGRVCKGIDSLIERFFQKNNIPVNTKGEFGAVVRGINEFKLIQILFFSIENIYSLTKSKRSLFEINLEYRLSAGKLEFLLGFGFVVPPGESLEQLNYSDFKNVAAFELIEQLLSNYSGSYSLDDRTSKLKLNISLSCY